MELLTSLTWILISALVLAVIVLAWNSDNHRRLNVRPFPSPPGPFRLPLLGNLLHASFHSNVPIFDYFAKLHMEYGKIFSFQAGVTAQVIVSDFDVIREISTNQSDVWIDRHTDEWLLERSYGKPLGILFSGGDLWRETRRFILRSLRDVGFGRQRTQDEQIRDELAELLQRIESGTSTASASEVQVQGGKLVDMKHLFSVSILNILWQMITGDRFEYDDPKLLELIKFMEVVSNNYSLAGDIYLAFPKLRHVLPNLTGHGKERRVYEPKMLEEFQNLLNKRRQINYEGEYLVDSFLKKAASAATEEAKAKSPQHQHEAYTDENFAVIISDLFFAGSETTSNTLEFAFQYMIQHPGVQTRVQAEIDAVIGRHRAPEYPDLARMPYTEATLLEIMRYSSVVPFVARVPREDVQLQLGRSGCGFSVPKETMVINNLHAVHFDVDFWGDPHVFRPERFLVPANGGKGVCPVKSSCTIPFGLGRRQCLGETLARASLFIYFATLLQRYTFEAWKEVPPKEGNGKRVGLTVAPLQYLAVLKHR